MILLFTLAVFLVSCFFALLLLFVIVDYVDEKRFNIKDTIIWLSMFLVILLIGIPTNIYLYETFIIEDYVVITSEFYDIEFINNDLVVIHENSDGYLNIIDYDFDELSFKLVENIEPYLEVSCEEPFTNFGISKGYKECIKIVYISDTALLQDYYNITPKVD